MDRIRIILSGMPRMLRDIVSSLVQGQPDMVVVAETESATHLDALSRRTRADVVIIGADANDGGLPSAGRRVVNRSPHVKILAVGAEGRHAWLYELRPHEQLIGEISPQELIGAIRSAVRAGAVPLEITGENPVVTQPTSPQADGAATEAQPR